MHILMLLFFLFFCCATSNNRRILHEPFIPLDTLPPSEPPKPPPSPPSTLSTQNQNPKHPYSTTTTTTPNNSPFFPNYPSPPPPPSLSNFATFPANISSLILPHSPTPTRSNSKLLPVALSAVTCAIVAAAVSAFVYFRRRRRNRDSGEDKDLRSDGGPRRGTAAKLRQSPSAAGSEFLYLGTVVNSRRIEGDRGDDGNSVGRKLESPELRPLPPLTRQVSAPPAVTAASEEEEEEEFYSPRGSSLGARESSGGTGSGSRRALSAIAGENFGELSSVSVSSSSSGSPERSHLISPSPPVRTQSKPRETKQPPLPPQPQVVTLVLSPALSPIHNQHVHSSCYSSSLCSSLCATPERGFVEEEEDINSNTVADSPLLFPLSLPTNRDLEEKTLDGNEKPCTNLDTDHHACASSSSSSSSSSPKERVLETNKAAFTSASALASPRLSNASNGSGKSIPSSPSSSSSSSKERVLKTNEAALASPRVSNASNGSRKSMPASPSRSSAKERVLKADEAASASASPRVSNATNGSRKSKPSSPSSLSSRERILKTNEVASASASPLASPRVSNAYSGSRKSMSLSSSSSLSSQESVLKTNEAASASASASASPRVSNASNGSRKSMPSSPSSSSSQKRVLKTNEAASALASPRVSNASNGSKKSMPSSPPPSSSQERVLKTNEVASELALASPPRPSNASNGSGKFQPSSPSSSSSSSSAFSLPSSPEKVMDHHGFDQSPRMSSVSDQFREPGLSSLPLSPTLLSSPEIERGLNLSGTLNSNESATVANGVSQRKHWEIPVLSTTTPFGQSGTIGNVLDQIIAVPVPHPPPVPQRKQWEIPVISTPIAPPPPPPPPPAPLQRQRKQWEVPAPTTPVGQSVSRPPELIPPSRPFVLQNTTTMVSPVELPPSSQRLGEAEEAAKPKLKPLHWDKVRASSDREMVWDHLKSSSFKLNEEMIETLFVVNTPNPKAKDATPRSVLPSSNQEERVLDPKKSQNIAILLRALNVTIEEVCEALLEGSADTLGAELLESLLRMAPSKEEERKLKEHNDDSPTKLGPAEKFLKALLDVPFAFKRVEAMLYIVNFDSEMEYLRKSFQTLEAACEELRNSRMFLKLLEAVLKTGNRMNVGTNRGDAQAFKLDTLLKLADVKGADGKTTLLHFVVQEIIRTEGARLSGTNQTPNSTLSEDVTCRRLGLQVVSSLSSELASVKKAAIMDSEVLSSDASKLSKGIANIAEVVRLNEMAGSDETIKKFTESMNKFIRMAEEEILKIQAHESVALTLVKEITEYFHGDLAKEEAHPFRIFMVVRDFLAVLDRVCKEVGMINERTMVSSAHKFPVPVNPLLPQPVNPMLSQPVNPMLPPPLPGLHGRRQHSNSSDDDTPSP